MTGAGRELVLAAGGDGAGGARPAGSGCWRLSGRETGRVRGLGVSG